MLQTALNQEKGQPLAQNRPTQGIKLVQIQNCDQNEQGVQGKQAEGKDKMQQSGKKEKGPGYLEQLWRALIRPPNRIVYKPQQLGPTSFVLDKTVIVKREDFKVKNSRGYNLECSYFEPIQISNKPHPCVLYLHGNSSSRNEGIVLIQYLLPFGISLVLMDFSGCGISEGEFISLGYYEKYDAKQVMDYVKNWKQITEFGLWGRSMGAATTLMTSLQEDMSIRFIVVDSSFLSIRQLCEEIASTTYKIPKFILRWAYSYIRGKVRGIAHFDLDHCDALNAVKNQKTKPSALFLVAINDTLISPTHSQKLFNLYRGSKKILMFEGTHNSRRPREINHEITKFFFDGLFDEYAMKQLKVFKMIPTLPDFNKMNIHQIIQLQQQKQQQQKQQLRGSISIPPPIGVNSLISEIHPSNIHSNSNCNTNKNQSQSSADLKNNFEVLSNAQMIGKSNSVQQFQVGMISPKIRYETSGQLMSKNVDKDEILQEEEEEDKVSNINNQQLKTKFEVIPNHTSQMPQPTRLPINLFGNSKSNKALRSFQIDADNHLQTNTFKFNKRDSFSKVAPSEVNNQEFNKQPKSVCSNQNTVNHNYYLNRGIQQSNLDSVQNFQDVTDNTIPNESSADQNAKMANQHIQFSNFRTVQQQQQDVINDEYDNEDKVVVSQKNQNENENVGIEDSKVYSVNTPNLPNQNFQINLNTEGEQQSPRQPKSQYNFDSNNILINFQRYNNTNIINGVIINNGSGGIINNGSGAIMNNGSITNQNVNKDSNQNNIKEEEDTQFNSKIDKFDQDNVNQNMFLSGFYIPSDHDGLQVQRSNQHERNNDLQNQILNSPHPSRPAAAVGNQSLQQQHGEHQVSEQAISNQGIIQNVPLDNTITMI